MSALVANSASSVASRTAALSSPNPGPSLDVDYDGWTMARTGPAQQAAGAASPRSVTARAAMALFDDLVGAGENRRRHGQAERVGGLEVDDQLEPRRLLDRQFGQLGAVEDLSGVGAE